jgi:hypothetical protein
MLLVSHKRLHIYIHVHIGFSIGNDSEHVIEEEYIHFQYRFTWPSRVLALVHLPFL